MRLASVEEKETIRSLLQPYLDELSRFPDEEADYRDGAGLYHYRYLDAYWTDAERFTYLLRVGGEIAGLALVRKAVEAGGHWEMAEYYVKPEFRRRGLGESAGTEILRTYPGP